VVKEYLDSPLGIKALAKKHGIRLHQLVLNWGNVYDHKKHQDLPKKVHTLQDVLSFMKRTGASRAETALHINKPANNLKWKSSAYWFVQHRDTLLPIQEQEN
jgi:transposase